MSLDTTPDDPRLEIEVSERPNSEDREALVRHMIAHGASRFGDPEFRSVGCFIRDEDGAMQGGLIARMRWKWSYVEMLWVDQDLRGRGLGRALLHKAEEFAKEKGGEGVHLETGGTDALPFYARMGYEVVGAMEGYPPGTSFHFLRKRL